MVIPINVNIIDINLLTISEILCLSILMFK